MVGEQGATVLRNGAVRHHITQMVLLVLVGFVLGLVVGMDYGGLLVTVAVTAVVGVMAATIYIYQDMVAFPSEISVDGTGLTLNFNGHQRRYAWNQVSGVVVLPPSRFGLVGSGREGRIMIKGQRMPYTLNFEVASVLKEHCDSHSRAIGMQQTYIRMPMSAPTVPIDPRQGQAPVMIKNKMDPRFLALGLILLAVALSYFTLSLIVDDPRSLAISLFLMLPMVLIGFWVQRRVQPSHVSIDANGFHLFIRGKGVQSYRWQQLTFMNRIPFDPLRVPAVKGKNFAIMVEGRTSLYRISLEPALALQRAYLYHTGSMLPVLNRG